MKISSHLKLIHIHIVFLQIIPTISGFTVKRIIDRAGTSIFSNVRDEDSLSTIDSSTTVDFPYTVEITKDSGDWINLASQYLDENGVCVLVHNQVEPFITSRDCQSTEDEAISHLDDLKKLIRKQGIDPDGKDGPFRYMEVVSRDGSGRRYDMPIPWKSKDHQSISSFHGKVEDIVGPIIQNLWKRDEVNVAASGFLINQPGSTSQNWHRDGPNEGLINVFIPLVDLTKDIGPTDVWTNTHKSEEEATSNPDSIQIAPLMKRGNILLMDYRTFHRGLGNFSKEQTRTLAYTVFEKGSSSLGDLLGYGLLPTAYRSIEETEINVQEDMQKLPFAIKATETTEEWAPKASSLFQDYGVCLIDDDKQVNRKVYDLVSSRKQLLFQKIVNRGIDPTGKESTYEFAEIASRDEGGGRYDMPVPWRGMGDIGTPFLSYETEILKEYHSNIEETIGPILNDLWGENNYHVSSCGFIENKSGSIAQQWHRLGCEEGSISVFHPLHCLNADHGVTEVWLRSHTSENRDVSGSSDKIAPLMHNGELMMLDWRTLRQNLGNTSSNFWQMAYITFKKDKDRESRQRLSGLTLEFD